MDACPLTYIFINGMNLWGGKCRGVADTDIGEVCRCVAYCLNWSWSSSSIVSSLSSTLRSFLSSSVLERVWVSSTTPCSASAQAAFTTHTHNNKIQLTACNLRGKNLILTFDKCNLKECLEWRSVGLFFPFLLWSAESHWWSLTHFWHH